MSVSLLLAYAACFSLLLVFFTSFRWRYFEFHAGGFERILGWHHRLVVVFTMTALLHVFIELAPYWGSFWHDLLLTEDFVLRLAVVVVAVFVSLIGLSFHNKIERKRWLRIHRLVYLGLIGVVWHIWSVRGAVFLSGEIVRNTSFILFLSGMALVCLVGFLHINKPELIYNYSNFTVSDRRLIGPYTELSLKLHDEKHQWEGGQFGFFSFRCCGSCGVSNEFHAFSIVGTEGTKINIIVQAIGDDTNCLRRLELGTQGTVLGPYGCLLPKNKSCGKALWIAGGIGILPFLGLINSLKRKKEVPFQIDLVVFRQAHKMWPWGEELERLQSELSWLRVFDCVEENAPYFNIADLEKLIPHWRASEISLAGPKAMIKSWQKSLKKAGFKKAYYHTEDFML